MIKAIVFDWHGVLDETQLEQLLKKIADITGLDKERVRDKMRPFERVWVAGTEKPDNFWKEIKKTLNLTDKNLEGAKSELLVVRKYEPLWNLLTELKEKYKLAILSDCPMDKVEVIRKQTDLSLFQEVYFSAERHLLKDSDQFFLNLLEKLNLRSEECLYVDDKEKHTTTAQRLGFQICTFKKIEDLLTCLNKFP